MRIAKLLLILIGGFVITIIAVLNYEALLNQINTITLSVEYYPDGSLRQRETTARWGWEKGSRTVQKWQRNGWSSVVFNEEAIRTKWNLDPFGTRQGRYEERYVVDGHLYHELWFRDDEVHGVGTYWSENGEIERQFRYVRDEVVEQRQAPPWFTEEEVKAAYEKH